MTLLASAQSCGQHLLAIINDILDFSKIESGKLVLDHVDFNLQQTINETVTFLTINAQKKGLELKANIDPAIPLVFRGDPGRIRQVLTNLIGNAIKFTKRGQIDLTIERFSATPDESPQKAPADSKACWLRFTVTDTGCGIDPELQAGLFDVFTQVDSSFDRKHEGAGLGLAISKQLVECMGGEIGCRSTPSQGSAFWFTVSLDVVTESDIQPKQANHKPPKLDLPAGRQRLLLVEDNAVNQLVTSKLLTILGYEHDTADNGAAALAALEKQAYTLILMDCQMPEMDGFEATRHIRDRQQREPNARALPIIAVTANALTGDRERCLAAGMDDFLAKPFSRLELLEILQRWLGENNAATG